MKKIIILISLCSVITTHAADSNSVGASYGLLSESNYSVTAGLNHGGRIGDTNYNLFSTSVNDAESQSAWVGLGNKYGELRLGTHDSLDSVVASGADQQHYGGAYDLLIQDESEISQSFTYVGSAGAVSLGAQVATDNTDERTKSTGLLLNAQSRSVEAAIAYRRTTDEAKAVKGRLTYKSRNNSRVRVDLVAEKVAIDDESSSLSVDSMSFMVGAKYSMTRKAYVVGQYGVVGFDDDVNLSSEALAENQDYNALSFEAGYSLSDNSSVYINHTQKSFDSSLQLPFADNLGGGSQTNSIGVRLNW